MGIHSSKKKDFQTPVADLIGKTYIKKEFL
jgi:hypothetical protein